MNKGDTRSGQSELRAARRQSRWLFASVFAFSIFVNLLMLTGPIFMLQVYDRVLTSQSIPTLLALTLLVLVDTTTGASQRPSARSPLRLPTDTRAVHVALDSASMCNRPTTSPPRQRRPAPTNGLHSEL